MRPLKDLWSAVYEAPTYDELVDLAIDGSGNIFVLGHMETVPPIVRVLGAGLNRYRPDGVLSWTVIDNRYGNASGALVADASGSAYILASWLTTRYDGTGQLVWTARYDGQPGVTASSSDLALTSAGDVIVTGAFGSDIHVVSYRQP